MAKNIFNPLIISKTEKLYSNEENTLDYIASELGITRSSLIRRLNHYRNNGMGDRFPRRNDNSGNFNDYSFEENIKKIHFYIFVKKYTVIKTAKVLDRNPENIYQHIKKLDKDKQKEYYNQLKLNSDYNFKKGIK